jgi:hypothetical protein
MRDIHTERSDNFCCLHFLYSKYLQNWRLPRLILLKKIIQQIKTLYLFIFLLKIKFNITLNIHIY